MSHSHKVTEFPEGTMAETSDGALASLVNAADRLEALSQTGLLDSPAEEAFDRITRLTARLLNVPVSLVSLIDARRQFFKSQVGLASPWQDRRETPLSYSFCQHVVGTGLPLIISDARQDARVKDNPAISDLGIVAYVGVPLRNTGGHVLGALCALDGEVRRWTPDQVAMLSDLGAIVMAEIARRENDRQLADQLRESEERLRLALERQTLLMHEVGHRVKNSLQLVASLLGMQARNGVNPEVTRALSDAETRIHAIAGVHDQLWHSGDFSSIDLGAFIAGLCTAVQKTTPSHTIRYARPADTLKVAADVAVPAGLLVNELVTNAVKHAYPDGTGEVRIELTPLPPHGFRLEVADDGCGLPPKAEGKRPAHGLGLRLIDGLVRQVHGTLRTETIHTGADRPGTRFILEAAPAPSA